jgi:hypothetical protein
MQTQERNKMKNIGNIKGKKTLDEMFKNFAKKAKKGDKTTFVRLDFMVHPDDLQNRAYIEDPVLVKIINPEEFKLLGESGKRMAELGFRFILTQKLAKTLNEAIEIINEK